MKATRDGFTAIELVIGLVTMALIIGAVIYALSAHTTAKQNQASSTPIPSTSAAAGTKVYSGTDYDLAYPTGWNIDTSNGGATSLKLVGDTANIGPDSNPAAKPAHITALEFSADADYLKTFNDANGYSVPPTQTSVTIHGNAGFYSVEKTAAYTTLDYVLYHNGHAVDIEMQLSSVAEGTTPAVDNSAYEPEFKEMAESVTIR